MRLEKSGAFIFETMKRDWSLLQILLTHFESETVEQFLKNIQEPEKWTEGQYFSDHLSGESEDRKAKRIVYEHLRLLHDGGYVDGVSIVVPMDNQYEVAIGNPRLTNEGHDLLQALRSNGLWSKIKEMAQSKGVELSLATVKALIPYAMKQIFE